MSTPPIERPNYFAGEALLTDDFICEQQYHMAVQSINNSSLYTYGIASGLEVHWDSAQVHDQVDVLPGMAIDSLGRQIILGAQQVVRFTDIQPGASYYLTISYAEAYADYTVQPSGVAGYKRIVSQPLIQPVLNLKEPGLNIVLAVVSFSSLGTINAINYRASTAARRYVSSTLGGLTLIAEGAGLSGNPVSSSQPAALDPNDATIYPRLLARLDAAAQQVTLEIAASRTQFDGVLNTLDNLGIGTSQPHANLEILPLAFDGPGAISSDGQLVSFSAPVSPFFQPGDVLRSAPPVTLLPDGSMRFGLAQQRTIVKAEPDKQMVTVDLAFDPPLASIGYTYQRALLARFGLDANASLLEVGIDGSVGLGPQASVKSGDGTPGRHALSIVPSGQVGIGLNDRDPICALDVGGQISAASIATQSLVAQGVVQAQSFVGNGSQLEGLQTLSYWTRETIGTPTSNLYYNEGNVGIRNSTPAGSLSVGGGQSVVGNGNITSLSNSVIQGYQSTFTQQVSVGDLISIGSIVQLKGVISEIVSDTELVLQQQFPLILTNSAYQYGAADGSAPQSAAGTISSEGRTVKGAGTSFTSKCQVGGRLVIDSFQPSTSVAQTRSVKKVDTATELSIDTAFALDLKDSKYYLGDAEDPSPGTISSSGTTVTGTGTDFTKLPADATIRIDSTSALPEKMRVKSVDSDTQLTMILPDGTPIQPDAQLFAITSVYQITPSLLAHFGVDPNPDGAKPPAMLVVTNEISDANSADQHNTVAINVPLGQVQSRYALQVDGDVNFTTGSIDADDLTVKTLTATVSAEVLGADKRVLFHAGEAAPSGAKPTLTVGGSAVTVTALAADSVTASGNITSQATVQGQGLVADTLQAGPLQVAANGSVALVGGRRGYSQNDLKGSGTEAKFEDVALTDGFVMATIGSPTWTSNMAGVLSGYTFDTGGNQTGFTYATALAYQISQSTGKKSAQDIYIPAPGSFTMPVRKGETWRVQLSWITAIGGQPGVEFYWVPLGSGSAGSNTVEAAAVPPGGGMAAQLERSLQDLREGRVGGMGEVSRQAIQQRMGDLTQVFGDATHMSPDAQARQRFTDELAKIVCAPDTAPVRSTSDAFQEHVDTLIDAFEQALARSFTGGERNLLADGVAALVRINDTAGNRGDLQLIRQNIGLFLENVQKVLNTQFDNGQLRMLTRALVRLVGDGSGADRV
ncbi:hypothetical protein [Burkholderia sp. Cy-637]|uniref:hypothetical protein n=1 Tax=Burkholderia sp. Cy-637 TaxID=2608327 RepID=UPI0014227A2F|nr:hypothetical protein [Burkholderia sp. Cy-637]NIF92704.1 hypothetical protein [Burkholderia sp. Cy-637]